MARQAIKSYAIDPAHTYDSHVIDRARSNRLRIVSVCGGYNNCPCEALPQVACFSCILNHNLDAHP